jgi:DNA-binding NarL/FixJ family response regulator
VRIAIAEDSGLFRSSLALLLRSFGAEVTVAVASGAELMAAIRDSPPDAVVLDIRMPPTFTDEGIRTAQEIRGRYPGTGILVLSTYAETAYASQLLDTVRSGVGYLLKDNVTDADALMESLERVAAGETVVDPAIVRRLLGRNRKPSVMDSLNEREFEVLRHMAEGRSNLGIAKELFLSARTVETHVTNVFTKLGLTASDTENNRVRAVLAFLRSAGAKRLRNRGAEARGTIPFSPHRALRLRPGHWRMNTSLPPKASVRSSPSSRAMKMAAACSTPNSSSAASAGGLPSSRVTSTRYPVPCLVRDTAAAVADGIVFLALRMAITTSATRRVCTCCHSADAPSPETEPVLGGM